MVFKVSLLWYVIERWIQTRILIRFWSRSFKRIGRRQSVQKYSRIYTWPRHNLLLFGKKKKIGKVSKLDLWVPHTLSKTKEDRISIMTNLLSRQKMFRFSKNIITRVEKCCFMTMFNAKDSWLMRMNLCSLLQKWSFMKEKLWCVYGRITVVLFILSFLNFSQTLNADFQHLQCVHENLRKWPALISWRNVVLLHDNPKPHSARIKEEKILNLG